MRVDLVVGSILACISWWLGFGLNSLWVLIAAFLPDLDVPWSEFWRIFIKREKKLNFSAFLDEYSYVHKFWLHNPIITLPIVFYLANWYLGYIFAILMVVAVFAHFVHDTVDHNFDGVRWLWPFSSFSFKLTSYFGWELQDAASLRINAEWRRWKRGGNGRTASEILKDNL